MPSRGDIVLARFPFTDGSGAKVRPVLVLAPVPGPHDDYLVLFISSQLRSAVPGIDVVLGRQHPSFAASGLKVPSVLRIGKLGTISSGLILGPLGKIGDPLLADVVRRVIRLLQGTIWTRGRNRLSSLQPGESGGGEAGRQVQDDLGAERQVLQ